MREHVVDAGGCRWSGDPVRPHVQERDCARARRHSAGCGTPGETGASGIAAGAPVHLEPYRRAYNGDLSRGSGRQTEIAGRRASCQYAKMTAAIRSHESALRATLLFVLANLLAEPAVVP